MTIGARIKRLREERTLTQAALAHACGVTVGQVSRWERDVDEPSLESIRSLARCLTATWEELLGPVK